METLLQMLTPGFILQESLIAAVIVGAVCPLVGAHFILRRFIFLGVALPQVSAAGIAGSFMVFRLFSGAHYHGEFSERLLALGGSTVLTAAALILLVWAERSSRTSADARIGAVYAAAAAGTILFLATDPQGEAEMTGILRGDLLAATPGSLGFLAIVFAVVIAVLVCFRRQFLLIGFDRELSAALKLRITAWDALLYLVIAVAVTVGVISAGPIVVFGFLVVPPLAARAVTSSMKPFLIFASLFGGVSAFVGFWFALAWDLPLGPSEVAVACLLLLCVAGSRLLCRGPKSA